jgi:NAD(P)-dependent dehydrogenase (short-subunit alcohol dehydrogenase family)
MPLIAGLNAPANALVTGASSGLGLAVVRALLQRDDVAQLSAVARRAGASAELAALADQHPARLRRIDADLTDPADLERLASAVDGAALHLLFNAAGLLHGEGLEPEKALSQLGLQALERSFAINAFAPILLCRALLPRLPKDAPCVLASLSARVGSIGDNRLGGWYSYRAAKAAQNQLLRTLSVELKRSHRRATVLLLHPGTVDTPLSAPFQARVPADKLFSPEHSAAQLLRVIAEATPERSGGFYAYDGSEIPW